jgi:transposase InsO family protein
VSPRATISQYRVAENLLDQNFNTDEINALWAADITFIWTSQGWLYLAVVMDLYSRRIVGWSMSRHIDRHLAVDALKMAWVTEDPKALSSITQTAVRST